MDIGGVEVIDLLIKYLRRNDYVAVVRILERAESRIELTKWLNLISKANLWVKLAKLIDVRTLKFIYDRVEAREVLKW